MRSEAAGCGTFSSNSAISRDGGPIEILIDVTPALETLGGSSAGGGRLTVSWLLDRTTPQINADLPEEIADSSCLT